MKTREQVLHDNIRRSVRKGLIAAGIQLGGLVLAAASLVLVVIFGIQHHWGCMLLMAVGVGAWTALAYIGAVMRIRNTANAREDRDTLDALRASRER